MRKALNEAENGELIVISRHERLFHLEVAKSADGKLTRVVKPLQTPSGKKINDLATPKETIAEIKPRLKTPSTPFRTEDEWEEAVEAESKCCKLKNPCKHWHYNPSEMVWKNEISGRQREVEQ